MRKTPLPIGGVQGLACVSRAEAGYEQRLWKGISLHRPKNGLVPNPALRPDKGTFLLGGGVSRAMFSVPLSPGGQLSVARHRGG